MACVANLQYGWTLFVNPIDAKYHWGRAAIQVAFTIFVLIETWLVPVEGYLVDRFGPRWVVIGGGILVGIAWIINSAASSLPLLYFRRRHRRRRHRLRLWHLRRQRAQVVSRAARARRRHHRRRLRRRRGAHHHTDLAHDQLRRLSTRVLCSSVCCRAASCSCWAGCCWSPPPQILSRARSSRARPPTATRPREVLRSPVFYVLYVMFVLIAAGGLTMAAP